MYMKMIAPLAFFALAACSGNPLGNVPDTTVQTSSVNPLPGTTAPTSSSNIIRYEARSNNGSGYAEGISYDANSDTFTVDNLAFDGGNAYTRGTLVSNLGPFAVYEGPNSEPDQFSGTPITQFQHRAIHAVSASGRTQFSIVRTGAYAPYGFGGFVYERAGAVQMPSAGQALYVGDYAAIRDFNGRSGLEYVTGSMEMAIDFRDFNQGSGVAGAVYNRQIYDVTGNNITSQVLTALSGDAGVTIAQLPEIVFTVGPGVIDANGELAGRVTTPYTNSSGATEQFATGNYYAVLAGPEAREVSGIIVIEGPDHRSDGVTARETGGFILVAPPPVP